MTLVEPTTSRIRLPGTLDEPAFLSALCDETGCRLLVDLATLLVASRNHGFDPLQWLAAIPTSWIAAVRIGGISLSGRHWQPDASQDIDPATWNLLDRIVCDARPELLLLDHRETAQGLDGLERDLSRLRRSASPQYVAKQLEDPPLRVVPDRSPASLLSRPSAKPSADPRDPRCAPGVALFVLDHEGVLVAEPRRELTQLNTAATFVWCLLEDGKAPFAIAREYTETFGVAAAEAERHVGTILRHWFGRGYITAPHEMPGDETPLLTALAWLITNEDLRAGFHRTPETIADVLAVHGEDRELLLQVHAAELDAQAELESASESTDQVSGPTPVPALPSGELERRYHLLSTTCFVRSSTPGILDRLDSALRHLATDLAADSGVTVHVTDARVAEAGRDAIDVRSVEALAPAVKQLLRERAVENYPFLLSIHAGVVAFGDTCVLLPAQAGSGKTTLTAALARAGATYFSDEIGLVNADNLDVIPVPLSLTIKDGSVAPLRHLYPELDELIVHVREDHVRVRYLPPPAAALPLAGATARARWIVFPAYAADATTELRPIDRPTALRRLLTESYMPPHRLNRASVEALVQWMRTVDCYELPFSSLDEAVSLISALPQRRN